MKFHKSILRVCCVAMFFSLACSVDIYAAARGAVNGDGVNVRLNPSTDAVVVATVNSGQEITITSKHGDFYRANYLDLHDVYLSTQFVDIVAADAMINSDVVNVRTHPSTGGQSQVITQFSTGDMIYITAVQGDWVEMIHNGTAAYVSREFVSGDFLDMVKQKDIAVEQVITDATAMVHTPQQQAESMYALVMSSSGLNLRTAPSSESPILSVLPFSAAAQVTDVTDGWVRVVYDSKEGFLSSEFVEIKIGVMPQPEVRSKGQELVAFAKQFLGTPYLWAGTNLQKGVDCSGFVYSVYRNYGITLRRSSADMVNNGHEVSKNELKAGDLVMFSSSVGSRVIGHVGIYIGNGEFIHSASGSVKRGVIISSMNEDFYLKTYKTARRIFD